MLARLSDPPFQLFQGRPGLDQPVDLLARGIVRLGLAVGKRLGEPGDRLGVDRIVLGQPSGRFGKMANRFGSTITTSTPATRRASAQLRS